MPVEVRIVLSYGTSRRSMAFAPVPGRCFAAGAAFDGFTLSAEMASSIVFQAPQRGQRPPQRVVSYPQAVHA